MIATINSFFNMTITKETITVSSHAVNVWLKKIKSCGMTQTISIKKELDNVPQLAASLDTARILLAEFVYLVSMYTYIQEIYKGKEVDVAPNLKIAIFAWIFSKN